MKKSWILWTNWEYYPWQIVYLPVYIYYLFNVLRTRHFFYFSNVNSNMKNAGFFGNSKTEMYACLPANTYPSSLLIKAQDSISSIITQLAEASFSYPLIIKPNIGERGEQLEKLDGELDLTNYLAKNKVDCIIQPFIDYPMECSIFCYRDNREQNFKITSVVGKAFLEVCGDGIQSLESLIDSYDRAYLQKESLRTKWEARFKEIIPKGSIIQLRPNANHSKGARFYDLNSALDASLSQLVNDWCGAMKGFSYGRFDIRYESMEALKKGESFKIIELNGIGAEPIDMYLPNIGVWRSWQILIKHWRLMYKISEENLRLGMQRDSHAEGLTALKAHFAYQRKRLGKGS